MSGNLVFYDDVQQNAINLLLSTFKEKEKFPALISALTEGFQELEYVYQELYNDRWIETAIGEQLDNAGQIPAQSRDGNDDETYRNNIKFKILENQSYGGIETIIEAIIFFTNSTIVTNIEVFPASIQAYCDGLTNGSEVPDNFIKNIDELCGGGIKFMFLAMGFGEFPFATDNPQNAGGTFDWLDGGGSPVGTGAGYLTWALQQ